MIELLCALHLAFWADCPSAMESYVGYVEGEYLEVAPVTSARINTLEVQRGDWLKAGDLIAIQESTDAENGVDQARAALQQAQAQLANLESGQRPEEIAVIEAELHSARVALQQRRSDRDRLNRLSESGQFVSDSELEQGVTAVETAEALVQQIEANLQVARLGAREDEIQAAGAAVEQALAQLADSNWILSERKVVAPASGRVTQIFRRPGENAGPTLPIIQLLPDKAWLVVFFVPQSAFANLQLGQSVELQCRDCDDSADLRISYLGQEVEYTPPVIYSAERRQELVYRVEARSTGGDFQLHPGQIVDVLIPSSQ